MVRVKVLVQPATYVSWHTEFQSVLTNILHFCAAQVFLACILTGREHRIVAKERVLPHVRNRDRLRSFILDEVEIPGKHARFINVEAIAGVFRERPDRPWLTFSVLACGRSRVRLFSNSLA